MYTIREAKEDIKNGILAYLLKDEEGQYVTKQVNRLPFYLEGAPGIGKTQIVKQIAKELGIGYVDFSLVHNTRNNILGLPVITTLENGEKYTNFTMSEIIAKVREQALNGKSEGILLLDEFPCMSETIAPIMLSFLQTKNIGCYTLPEGWVIVLCGNPREYNKSARTFDPATTDRIRKFEVNVSLSDFMEYGQENQIHPLILSFLTSNKECIYICQTKEGKQELVTCRSWENLSVTLQAYEKLKLLLSENVVKQFIKSDKIARSFMQYYKKWSHGFNAEELTRILNGEISENAKRQIRLLSYGEKWSLMQMLLKQLKAEYENIRLTEKQKQQMVNKLQAIFDFARCDEEWNNLWEQIYITVNKDPLLLKAVSEKKCDSYVEMCQKKYLVS